MTLRLLRLIRTIAHLALRVRHDHIERVDGKASCSEDDLSLAVVFCVTPDSCHAVFVIPSDGVVLGEGFVDVFGVDHLDEAVVLRMSVDSCMEVITYAVDLVTLS